MRSYELTFVIDPIDDDTVDRLAENGIDWSKTGRLQFTHVDQMADDPMSAVREAFTFLMTLGVHPIRSRLDLVSSSEIAARAGVSRPAVTKWTKQVSGANPFPIEYDWSTTGPLWVWHDVNEWLQATGKSGYDEYCTLSRESVEEADGWISRHESVSARA